MCAKMKLQKQSKGTSRTPAVCTVFMFQQLDSPNIFRKKTILFISLVPLSRSTQIIFGLAIITPSPEYREMYMSWVKCSKHVKTIQTDVMKVVFFCKRVLITSSSRCSMTVYITVYFTDNFTYRPNQLHTNIMCWNKKASLFEFIF